MGKKEFWHSLLVIIHIDFFNVRCFDVTFINNGLGVITGATLGWIYSGCVQLKKEIDNSRTNLKNEMTHKLIGMHPGFEIGIVLAFP